MLGLGHGCGQAHGLHRGAEPGFDPRSPGGVATGAPRGPGDGSVTLAAAWDPTRGLDGGSRRPCVSVQRDGGALTGGGVGCPWAPGDGRGGRTLASPLGPSVPSSEVFHEPSLQKVCSRSPSLRGEARSLGGDREISQGLEGMPSAKAGASRSDSTVISPEKGPRLSLPPRGGRPQEVRPQGPYSSLSQVPSGW